MSHSFVLALLVRLVGQSVDLAWQVGRVEEVNLEGVDKRLKRSCLVCRSFQTVYVQYRMSRYASSAFLNR